MYMVELEWYVCRSNKSDMLLDDKSLKRVDWFGLSNRRSRKMWSRLLGRPYELEALELHTHRWPD